MKAIRPPDEVLARIRQRWSYDPETGVITDLERGVPVGGLSRKIGYSLVWITLPEFDYRKRQLAQRLAWFLYHGEWPDRLLDHVNRDRLDNRIENLRLADNAQNSHNMTKKRTWHGRPTSSKFKGVCWNKDAGKWQANIRVNGKLTHLGLFTSEEEAAEAYRLAAIRHFGEFASQDSGVASTG